MNRFAFLYQFALCVNSAFGILKEFWKFSYLQVQNMKINIINKCATLQAKIAYAVT